MVWYYVDAGKQAGPVDEAQFQNLIQTGKVLPDTLVWREGMANWQACREVVPGMASPPSGTPPPPPAPGASAVNPTSETAGQVACVQCRTQVPQNQAIQYGSVWVCPNCQPGFVQRLREGSASMAPYGGAEMTDLPYAGFWIRFLAKFIDGLILGVVVTLPIFLLLLGTITNAGPSRRGEPDFAAFGLQIILQIVITIVSVLYNGFFLGKFGATPGKMALGLKVVNADGTSINYGRGFLRSLAELLSGLVCYIGYIIAAFDREKRTLHDHLVNTRVIKTR